MTDPIKEAARKVQALNRPSNSTASMVADYLFLLFMVFGTVVWSFSQVGNGHLGHKIETVREYEGLMSLLSKIEDYDGAMELIAFTDYGDNVAPWVQVTTKAIMMSSPSLGEDRMSPDKVGQAIRRGFHRLEGLDLYLYLGFIDRLDFEKVKTGLQSQEVSELKGCFESMRRYYAPEWRSSSYAKTTDEHFPQGFKLMLTGGFPWMMNPPCKDKAGIQLLSLSAYSGR